MAKQTKTVSTKKTVRASSSASKKKTAMVAVGTAAAMGAMSKKVTAKVIIIAIAALILMGAIGFCVCFFAGKNDYFEINGNDELTFQIGESYHDEGVSIKEFGLNMSGLASVKTNLKKNEQGDYYADEIGTYYIAYTAKTIKMGWVYNIQKVRLITFVEAGDSDEITEEEE